MTHEKNPASVKSDKPLQPPAPGALQSRNIRIHKQRTSVRLEPKMWNALKEIAALERCSIHDLCSAVHDLKEPTASFTAALRVFMMEYYRSASRTGHHPPNGQRQAQAQQETE